jgi:protein-S-isoprenylcysteine O-methyltransferase Ste14
MTILLIAVLVRICWLLVEVRHLRRYRVMPARDWDRHSATVWDIANGLEPLGLVLGFMGVARIPGPPAVAGILGLTLLLGGIVIRWTAIYTLGKYFTGTVLIREDHCLVETGLYRYIRHPAYAGALIAHAGLGLAFMSWFSLALSSIHYLVAAFYRIRVEEKALRDAFGEHYVAYSMHTKRLIPGVY